MFFFNLINVKAVFIIILKIKNKLKFFVSKVALEKNLEINLYSGVFCHKMRNDGVVTCLLRRKVMDLRQ